MSADRGVDEDQSREDQAVFYLFVLYHVRLSFYLLPLYGVLAQYQEVYFNTRGREGVE